MLQLTRDQKLWFSIPFNDIHAAMHPNARGTIVNIPPVAEPRGTVANTLPSAPAPRVNEDLLGIFDTMAVSKPTVSTSNPFDLVPKPDPPEVVVANTQSHITQQGPGTASTGAAIVGSAQAPIQIDAPLQPTIVPIPIQPLAAGRANNPAQFTSVSPASQQQHPSAEAIPSNQQVVQGHHQGYNPAGYAYAQPTSQPVVPQGQGASHSGYNSHYNQGQASPQYLLQAGYPNGVQQPPQQQAPPKSTNPFDPFA